jgi:cytoskeletal protein CcmA (bactofilin family)
MSEVNMSFFSGRRQADVPPEPVEDSSPAPRPSLHSPQPVGFDTVLGANCEMEGVLRSRANVRLDGTFTGTLEIDGNVLVGETARITADINAKNVSIAGAVRGNVSGKKVQLLRTGRIWGDIHATALTTEEGAFIDGKIAMMGRETPDMAPAAEAASPSYPDEAEVDTLSEPEAEAAPDDSGEASVAPDEIDFPPKPEG